MASWENRSRKEQAKLPTVDIPVSLYRKLKEQAAAQGRSIRELLLLGVRVTLNRGQASAFQEGQVSPHRVRWAESRLEQRTDL
jgi:hypothetical protein